MVHTNLVFCISIAILRCYNSASETATAFARGPQGARKRTATSTQNLKHKPSTHVKSTTQSHTILSSRASVSQASREPHKLQQQHFLFFTLQTVCRSRCSAFTSPRAHASSDEPLDHPSLRLAHTVSSTDHSAAPITIQAQNNSNDFGFLFELISRFDFDFRRRGIFF